MRRFPIDTLKVDRSFVRDLTMDSSDASVVSAIINMGSSLHMRVVAEGVESPDQALFLAEHSCPRHKGSSSAGLAGEGVLPLDITQPHEHAAV